MGDAAACGDASTKPAIEGAASGPLGVAVEHVMADNSAASPMARNSPAPSLDDSPM